MYEAVSGSLINAVYVGLWTVLASSLGGIWWLGIGLFLRREQPALGLFTVVLGIFVLLDALGRILNIQIIYTVGLAGVLLLIPMWSLWFGIDLLGSRKMRIKRTVSSVSEQE